MITKEMNFYSNGYKLKAAIFLPDDYQEGTKLPCLLPNSGYMGLRNIYPELFARAFTKQGYAVFGFDYRGFLDNEGPAGVCKLEEQVDDIRTAITFASALPQVDAERMFLLGWGMAAALVMKAAALEPSIQAVAGLNGFYDGERWLKAINTYADFVAMKAEVEVEKLRMAQEGVRKFDNPFHFYPLDPATNAVVQDNLYTVKDYGQDISLEVGQSILEYNAERYAKELDIPVFVGHGKDNLLHPISESFAFYQTLEGDNNELYVIPGKHNDFMFDDHPVLNDLVAALHQFFCKA